MGLNRQDKAAVIEEVAGIVANSSSIVIAEYRGLSVEPSRSFVLKHVRTM